MLNNYKAIGIVLIFFDALSHPALADNFYGALDIGATTAMEACKNLAPQIGECDGTVKSLRVGGGYQFTPEWGIELSYAKSDQQSAGMILGTSVFWQVSGLQLSAIRTFPLVVPSAFRDWLISANVWDADSIGKFSVLAKLGIARTELKLSEGVSASAISNNTAYGIGIQYDYNKIYSARIQYEYLGLVGDINTGTSRVTLTSAGLVYKF